MTVGRRSAPSAHSAHERELHAASTCGAACEARFVALEARIAALEAVRLIAEEDVHLRIRLADDTQSKLFYSSELFDHAEQLQPGLVAALAAARLRTPDDLGRWLRDNRGVRDGIAIMRVGRQWRVVRVDTSHT